MRSIQLSLLAVVTAALTACGGGAKLSKEGAIEALFQAQQTTSKSGQGLKERLLASSATTITVEADCDRGGKVKLTLNASDSGTSSGSLTYNIQYNNCSQDGTNTYNGTLDLSFNFTGGDSSAEVAMTMRGRLDISGEIGDFVDANVTMTVAVASTSASGTVSIRTNGTIRTSTETYNYNNESVTITVDGSLDAQS